MTHVCNALIEGTQNCCTAPMNHPGIHRCKASDVDARTGKQKLFPYDRVRSHLISEGWRGIAGWNRDAKMSKQQIAESTLDLYAKNGRVILLGAGKDGGCEVWYPSPTMKTGELLVEIEAYARSGIHVVGLVFFDCGHKERKRVVVQGPFDAVAGVLDHSDARLCEKCIDAINDNDDDPRTVVVHDKVDA